MATHISAVKRAKQSKKRKRRNLSVKTMVKSSIKKVRTAIEQNDVEGARNALQNAIPLIQKAHTKGVLHRNTSARKISRLSLEVNALQKPLEAA